MRSPAVSCRKVVSFEAPEVVVATSDGGMKLDPTRKIVIYGGVVEQSSGVIEQSDSLLWTQVGCAECVNMQCLPHSLTDPKLPTSNITVGASGQHIQLPPPKQSSAYFDTKLPALRAAVCKYYGNNMYIVPIREELPWHSRYFYLHKAPQYMATHHYEHCLLGVGQQ